MKIETHKKEYCQHCGTDFSRRSYSDKIHHKNHCDEFNADVAAHRFKEAKTEKEKLRWLFESVGMDCNIDRTSYEATMEIFECLMTMYRSGIYNDDEEKDVKYPQIADYMKSKTNEIKKEFNKLIQEKINNAENEKNQEIKRLKMYLIK